MSMQDYVTKYFEHRYLFTVEKFWCFNATIRTNKQPGLFFPDTNSRQLGQNGLTTYALVQNKCSMNPKLNCSGVFYMAILASTSIGGSVHSGRHWKISFISIARIARSLSSTRNWWTVNYLNTYSFTINTTLLQTISIDDFEKIVKATFPLKSEVDIKNLTDVVRKQLKIKMNTNEMNLDKLFQEVGPECKQMF